jgi:hypothetical protein
MQADMQLNRLCAAALLSLLLSLTAAAQTLSPGTALPVMLNSALNARHDKPGDIITGKIMQDVPLPDGAKIPKGAKIIGQIVSARSASAGSPSQITLKFNQLEYKRKRVPISTHLRAVASMFEVYEAWMPTNAIDDYGTSPSDWNTVQIGGAGVFRGAGKVMFDDQVVGTATDYGATTAKLTASPDRGCTGTSDVGQALWTFSPWACGSYGLGDLKIVHSGKSSGEIELQSSGDIHIRGGSGWLLRANPVASDGLKSD